MERCDILEQLHTSCPLPLKRNRSLEIRRSFGIPAWERRLKGVISELQSCSNRAPIVLQSCSNRAQSEWSYRSSSSFTVTRLVLVT